MGTKHIIKDFTISEVSFVDRPAQEGALMVMMKRQGMPPTTDRRIPMSKGDETTRSFDQAASEIAKRDNVSRTEAYSRARRENAAVYERMQTEGLAVEKAARSMPEPATPTAPEQHFNSLVAQVTARDRVPRHVAARRARLENPEAWQAMQKA